LLWLSSGRSKKNQETEPISCLVSQLPPWVSRSRPPSFICWNSNVCAVASPVQLSRTWQETLCLIARSMTPCFVMFKKLFDIHRELLPPSVAEKETLQTRVQVYLTLRRTSDTRALKQKVNQSDIDMVNRWKALEHAEGNRPHRPKRQHYANLELFLKPFLR
jgi:hypothetical protein